MNTHQMDFIRQKMRQLLQQQFHRSAEIFGHFLLAYRDAPSDRSRLKNLELFGDVLCGLGEHGRAGYFYQQASMLLEPSGRNIDEKEDCAITPVPVIKVEAKLVLSLWDSGEVEEALRIASQMRMQDRPNTVNERMAYYYKHQGELMKATSLFQFLWKRNRYNIDAAIQLLRLSASADSVISECQKAFADAPQWVMDFMRLQASNATYDYISGKKKVIELLKIFPQCYPLLTLHGYMLIQTTDPELARPVLEQAHEADPYNLQSMDMLAWIYRNRNQRNALNRLIHDLLAAKTSRPEPYIALALFYDCLATITSNTDEQRQNAREVAVALKLIDKAIRLDPNHLTSHLVKGYLCLAIGETQTAVKCYQQAFLIDKHEISTFQGLTEAYLSAKNVRQAFAYAKQVLAMQPKNPKALALVGIVLASNPGSRQQAMKKFKLAIKYDPFCVDAITGLVRLYCGDNKVDLAIKLLEEHVPRHNSEHLHVRLGKLYATRGDVELAENHYRTAISIRPDYRLALSGLEELGHIMREIDTEDIDTQEFRTFAFDAVSAW